MKKTRYRYSELSLAVAHTVLEPTQIVEIRRVLYMRQDIINQRT